MNEEIKKHFVNLGGLNLDTLQKEEEIFKEEILSIEKFTNLRVDRVLRDVWSEYNGQYFNKNVGILTDIQIPILENSNFIDFSKFFPIKSKGDIIENIKSNEDIFGKEYLPFAEALEGDYFAYNLKDGWVYFILHDFNEIEESHYKISITPKDFFLQLETITSTEVNDEIKPTFVKSSFSKDFLEKAKKFRDSNKNK